MCAVGVLLSMTAVAQSSAVKISTEDELKSDLASGPCKSDERLGAVKAMFKRMGAADADIKIDEFKDIKNVVLTKKGTTDETVVIGAHYDKVFSGCGILDNWSGVVILTHLYRTISSGRTRKTYVFVAFDQEERGLRGSAAMVKAILPEDRAKYCSMVNLDSFGLGSPVILASASSSTMTKFAKDLAKELKVNVQMLSLQGTADADSSSFKDKDIPAITITALRGTWQQYIHSSSDRADIVSPASVRIGYQFSLQYIARIEEGSCAMFRDR